MGSEALGRDDTVQQDILWGGNFYVALNGPTGEATEVLIGIENPALGLTVARSFDPDTAEEVANKILSDARRIREGK